MHLALANRTTERAYDGPRTTNLMPAAGVPLRPTLLGVVGRTSLRVGSVVAALACLAGTAWFVLDWADYGSDGTCGNLIRYKGAGGNCAHIAHGRTLGAVLLGVAALALLTFAVIARPRRTPDSH